MWGRKKLKIVKCKGWTIQGVSIVNNNQNSFIQKKKKIQKENVEIIHKYKLKYLTVQHIISSHDLKTQSI